MPEGLGSVNTANVTQFNIRAVTNGYVATVNFREEVYQTLDQVIDRVKAVYTNVQGN